MRLLQKYPWLIPSDGHEWVPVEATPIAYAAEASINRGDVNYYEMPARSPWPRSFIEFSLTDGVRARTVVKLIDSSYALYKQWTPDTKVPDTVSRVRIGEVHMSVVRGRPALIGGFVDGYDSSGHLVYGQSNPVADTSRSSIKDRDTQSLLCTRAGTIVRAVFAFLNCKNVTVENEYVPPAVRAKRQKGGKKADIIYKQLVVDGKPITRQPGRESKEDADRRYHICRGHFADHREHGLFSKPSLRGIYWVPMHVRGSKSNGEVIKDYKVQPA